MKKKNNNITIRFGAAHHSVTAGDVTIDFCKAHRDVRYQTRRTIVEGLKQNGYFGKSEQRKALYRARQEAKANA